MLDNTVWEEWPPRGKTATLSGAMLIAIDRYRSLLMQLDHNAAKDKAVNSVLSDIDRPGVKLGGMLVRRVKTEGL